MKITYLTKMVSILIFTIAIANNTYANPVVNKVPIDLVKTEAFNIQSEVLGLALNIKVTVPITYKKENKEKKYPVVYLTDGNLTGSMMGHSNIMRSFAYINPAPLPETITVAMDFITDDFQNPDTTFEESIKLRADHFAPTRIVDPYYGEIGGKAAKFVEFIQTELKEFIQSNYNINKHNQTFVGHSDGGLFALYMLFTAPDSFNNYIAVSPSVSWDNNVIFNYESSYADQYGEMNKKLYMALAMNEDNTGEMFGLVKTMTETIKSRKYAGLDIKMQVFEDENHASVTVPAFANGIRFALIEKNSHRSKRRHFTHENED